MTAYGIGCDVHPRHPTRAGTQPVVGFTVAADPHVLPIGSIVDVEGVGELMVHDTGARVKGFTLDIFVGSCTEARAWGRQRRLVRVLHVPGRRVRLQETVAVRGESLEDRHQGR